MLESKAFEFDRVFGNDSTQADVFDEVQPMVTSALDGFHACIFAYGQTGSGKTHTMEGPLANRGVYFRALNEMFALIEQRADAYSYSLRVQMVEIYNENVVDLLAEPTAATTAAMEEEEGGASLEIKQGPNGNYLPDATILDVTSAAQVEAIMAAGARNRTVGRTNANEHSSRSHSLLMVDIAGVNRVAETKTYGRLVLVDLAGSERVSKSGAEGARLKEAQNINKSLSALGDVMAALANKTAHVPFRNSKLTYLLQDSLGKDNKTLMIVQVSPVTASRGETLCSLNFAARVRKVELGKAVKHADSGEVAKLRSELRRVQANAAAAAEEVCTLDAGDVRCSVVLCCL
jgi:kinesin family protein C2/C3